MIDNMQCVITHIQTFVCVSQIESRSDRETISQTDIQSVGQPVCHSFSWSIDDRSVSRSVCHSVIHSVCRSFGQRVSRSVGRSVGQSVSQSVSQLARQSIRCFISESFWIECL